MIQDLTKRLYFVLPLLMYYIVLEYIFSLKENFIYDAYSNP